MEDKNEQRRLQEYYYITTRMAGTNVKGFLSGNMGWYLPKAQDLFVQMRPYLYCSSCGKMFPARIYPLDYCNNCRYSVEMVFGGVYTKLDVDYATFVPESISVGTVPMSNKHLVSGAYYNGGQELNIILQQSYLAAIKGMKGGVYEGFVLPHVSMSNRYKQPSLSGVLLTPLQAAFYTRYAMEYIKVRTSRIKEAHKDLVPTPKTAIDFIPREAEASGILEEFNRCLHLTEREFTQLKKAYVYESIFTSR